MSSKLMAKRIFQAYQLVASQVGNKVEFLKETSCMSKEKRLELAYCKVFRERFSDDEEFNKFLKETAEPALTILGFAEWDRDILTDMGLRISTADVVGSLKDLHKNDHR